MRHESKDYNKITELILEVIIDFTEKLIRK